RSESLAQRNYASLLSFVMAKDSAELARHEAEMSEARVINSSRLAEYEKTIITQKGRDLFSRLATARTDYLRDLDEVIRLKRAGKDKEAQEYASQKTKISNGRYLEAAGVLVEYRKSVADDKSAEIERAVSSARTGITVGLALVLILATVVAFLIVRRITVPLKDATELLGGIAEGDVTRKGVVRSNDEFGQMMGAMNHMVDNLKSAAGVAQSIAQ